MSATRRGLAFRDLGRLFRNGTLPSGDGALLECFLAEGDESAFEAIVARHGSMVLGVCRRLLGDPHDADDAFQATFLVLVRKARQLRDAERLGPWLYGVATRVATKARAREAKRRGRLRALPVDIPAPRDLERDWLDVRSVLDAELGKLSPKLRDILVLCLLEGFTADEASRQLSCPLGTVKSRLARGREALRRGLTARGLAPASALAVAAGGSRSALASPVSQALSLTTVRMAGLAPERIPQAVVALTRGVATNMLHKSSALAAVVCGGVALAGAGLVAWQKPHANAAEPGAQEAREAPDQARHTSITHILPGLDDADEMGVLVGMADGSARYVPRGDAAFWRKLITPAGGEVLVWPSLPKRMRQQAQRPANVEVLPTPAASPPTQVTINTAPASPVSPDLDVRLRAIEAKLDRLLRKLDAVDEGPAPH